jgi:hypothetical protein
MLKPTALYGNVLISHTLLLLLHTFKLLKQISKFFGIIEWYYGLLLQPSAVLVPELDKSPPAPDDPTTDDGSWG